MYDVAVPIHHATVVSLRGLHVTNDLPALVSQQFPTDRLKT